VLALGCGGGGEAPAHPDAGPPSVPPITAVDEQWTWVPVALLDYTQDSVLPGFLDISTQVFGQGLDALAKQRLDPLPRFRYFFVDQSDHVLLPHPDLAQNGVKLGDWIRAMFDGDPSWVDVHP
jgi:hypothetical protein